MSADQDAGWQEALDQIEADVARAQTLITSPADPEILAAQSAENQFTPAAAAGLGPVPDGLRVRAHAVLNRQQAVQRELSEALQATRAHLRVVESLVKRNAPQAVYLDILG
ncbi:hypothetical protein SAMN05216410_2371 [Sanguibacter gelidistatuariae]|uniref:Uncharacterized protein n=1 Tax=Sanguibacter gelidistatuariae TaxID=1814289 RepID=A0A1G6PXQ9_9MICO|nr:hypothetical protein [Sanguibacter gelidistatuariae]SDC84306.1 hypothetical protein SAMN05216410_2371 [Sanguibacter gelidistatuariae]